MVTGVGTTIQPQSAGVITSTTSMGTPTVIQGAPATGGVESSVPQRRASDNRRSNKPIMEKRRRARINNCLNDLKTLILDAMKKDPARHSKLEKADILEMTVKHLENLQRQQAAMSAAADPSIINKFRAGFSECVSEVGRFQGLESTIKRRLIQHLANCLQINTNTILTTAPQPQQSQPKEQQNTPLLSAAQSTTVTVQQPSVQLHILPQQEPQNGIFFTNGNGTGVQLVPTRLPNGDIALILPTSITPAQPQRQQYAPQNRSTNTSPVSSASSSPLPMLIPIPAQQQQQRPYVIQSVQSSIPSPQDRPSSSTSSMSNASRLSPCRQSSPGYSMPGSPYEIMDTSITSSRKSPVRQPSPYQRPPPPQVQEQMPLSLVIRKAPPSPTYQHKLKQDMNEILNEKPWRPW